MKLGWTLIETSKASVPCSPPILSSRNRQGGGRVSDLHPVLDFRGVQARASRHDRKAHSTSISSWQKGRCTYAAWGLFAWRSDACCELLMRSATATSATNSLPCCCDMSVGFLQQQSSSQILAPSTVPLCAHSTDPPMCNHLCCGCSREVGRSID